MNTLKQIVFLLTILLALALAILAGLAYFEPSQQERRDSLAALEVQQAETEALLTQAQKEQAARLRAEQAAALAPLQLLTSAFWLLFLPCAALALFLVGLDAYRLRRAPMVVAREGLLPVARRALEEQPEAALALLAAFHEEKVIRARLSVSRVNTCRASQEEESLPFVDLLPQEPGLPTAPAFASLWADGFRPTMDRLLLGYGASGPIHGTIDDLLSTLVVGRPGTGKTTALRFLLAQLVACGAELAILDPHGSLADVATVPATWRAESAKELDRVSAALCRELDSRLARRRAGEREFRPLLLLVDEWNILAEMHKPVVEVARRYILEARKVRGYALISGQGAPAASFGSSVARDGLSSRLILWTTAQQARMAGLESESAKLLLPRLADSPRGHGILARSSSEPEIIAIPNTLPSDLTLALPMVSNTPKQAGSHPRSEAETIVDSTARESTKEASPESTNDRTQQVKNMLKEGYGLRDIIRALWGVDSGRKYNEAQDELRAIIAELV